MQLLPAVQLFKSSVKLPGECVKQEVAKISEVNDKGSIDAIV